MIGECTQRPLYAQLNMPPPRHVAKGTHGYRQDKENETSVVPHNQQNTIFKRKFFQLFQNYEKADQLKLHKVNWFIKLWNFSRPHTVIGSLMAIISLSIFATPKLTDQLDVELFAKNFLTVASSGLLVNLYITGLNQIIDVPKDIINKPYLPIPSGQLSVGQAKLIVGSALILCASICQLSPYSSKSLGASLFGGALLGTLYSVPPIRLQKYPSLAALSILFVRGICVNGLLYTHFKHTKDLASNSIFDIMDPKCYLTTLYTLLYGFIIAIFKDIIDVQGDKASCIKTFPMLHGRDKAFQFCRRLLQTVFLSAAAASTISGIDVTRIPSTLQIHNWRRLIGGAIFTMVAVNFSKATCSVDPLNDKECKLCYDDIWKLFYFSYGILPFLR